MLGFLKAIAGLTVRLETEARVKAFSEITSAVTNYANRINTARPNTFTADLLTTIANDLHQLLNKHLDAHPVIHEL